MLCYLGNNFGLGELFRGTVPPHLTLLMLLHFAANCVIVFMCMCRLLCVLVVNVFTVTGKGACKVMIVKAPRFAVPLSLRFYYYCVCNYVCAQQLRSEVEMHGS